MGIQHCSITVHQLLFEYLQQDITYYLGSVISLLPII